MDFLIQKNKIIVFSIVIILIISGIAIYQLIEEKPDKEKKVESEKEIDFSISPYTNQGLIVEIIRIRHRDLLEKMLQIGTSWKNAPSFYYILNVDGKEGNPKGNLGKSGVYNTWDTLGMESNMNFYTEEEQVFSDVTISIKEIEESGLFGRRTEEFEKEKIELTYDYRTGRWTGDDYLKDKDGYGHYLGETYEVWFNIYQSDYDNDGIPYWTEVNILGTDPTVDDSKLDPDNDGIPTSWEWKWGYDPFTWDDHENLDPDVDGIENIEEYKMRKYMANPFHPDIYIETDGMEKKGIFDLPHEFSKEGQQMIIERFAQHGISVFIDDGWPDGPINGGGEMLPFHVYVDDSIGKQTLSFYEHNFADERKGVFRYVIMGYDYSGFTCPNKYLMFDVIHVGTSLKNTLSRLAFTPRQFIVSYSKVVLHELGHTLGLVPITFYGNDIIAGENIRWPETLSQEDYEKYADNYYSIMNYKYIYRDRKLFDYSDGSNDAKYDYNDWANIYLPSFQTDQISYEEPSDETFDDFEVVDDYPGVILEDYEYDKNVTEENIDLIKSLDHGINECKYKVYINKENKEDAKIYARQITDGVFTKYILIGSGKIDDGKISVYSIDEEVDNLLSLSP